MMGRYRGIMAFIAALFGGLILLNNAAYAQTKAEGIELIVQPDDIGIMGRVRAGTWTPLRVTIRSTASAARTLECQWITEDIDGDTVRWESAVTAVRGSEGSAAERGAWLYAVPPIITNMRQVQWRINVLEQGNVILSTKIFPPRPVGRHVGVIGTTSTTPMSLDDYAIDNTQNEPIHLINGIRPADLPDQWYGLSIMDALIWTREGGAPDAPGVPTDAIAEWVRRGGHLVIALDSGAGSNSLNNWLADHPLGRLMPELQRGGATSEPVELNSNDRTRFLPGWLGVPSARTAEEGPLKISVQPLVPTHDSHGQVILHHGAWPLVVARRVGMGRVTVIGVDLTDPGLRKEGMPQNGTLWRSVFGWQGPAIDLAAYKKELEDQDPAYNQPGYRNKVVLAERHFPQRTAMTGSVATPLAAAIFLFLLYGLAVPIIHAILRVQGKSHWGWMAFTIAVAAFGAVAWTGGSIARPQTTRISHFSVLTINADEGDGLDNTLHTHSWLSLYVAKHGDVEVAIDPLKGRPDAEGRITRRNPNTLTSAGLSRDQRYSGFVDPQTYGFSADRSHIANIPMRSTAKQLEADYFGRVGDITHPDPDEPGVPQQWGDVEHDVYVDNKGILRGWIAHGFPRAVSEYIVVYSPGGDVYNATTHRTSPGGVRVWSQQRGGAWQPGVELRFGTDITGAGEALLIEPPDAKNRVPLSGDLKWDGFLGNRLVYAKPTGMHAHGGPMMTYTETSESNLKVHLQLLNFYAMLPHPRFQTIQQTYAGFGHNIGDTATSYKRIVGRNLDLTPALVNRCVIIIGFIDRSAPLPMPMTVDGQTVEAFEDPSMTMVRIVIPVKEKAAPATGDQP